MRPYLDCYYLLKKKKNWNFEEADCIMIKTVSIIGNIPIVVIITMINKQIYSTL